MYYFQQKEYTGLLFKCLFSFYSIFFYAWGFLELIIKFPWASRSLAYKFNVAFLCYVCFPLFLHCPRFISLSFTSFTHVHLNTVKQIIVFLLGDFQCILFCQLLETLGKKPCLRLITPLFSTGWDFKPVKIYMIGLTDCLLQWCSLAMANGLLSEKANGQEVNSNHKV